MSKNDAQRKPLGDWKKGRELLAKNFQEVIPVVRSLQQTIITPQQLTNQSKGFSI